MPSELRERPGILIAYVKIPFEERIFTQLLEMPGQSRPTGRSLGMSMKK